jgi:hypothetical protein
MVYVNIYHVHIECICKFIFDSCLYICTYYFLEIFDAIIPGDDDIQRVMHFQCNIIYKYYFRIHIFRTLSYRGPVYRTIRNCVSK